MLVQRMKKTTKPITTTPEFEEVVNTKDETDITSFSNETVTRLRKELQSRLEGIYGLDVRLGRITYGKQDLKLKLEINIPVDEMYADNMYISAKELTDGKGVYGTPVFYTGKGKKQEAIILKSRRKKYLFKFTDEAGEWLAPFRTFTLRTIVDRVANKSF